MATGSRTNLKEVMLHILLNVALDAVINRHARMDSF